MAIDKEQEISWEEAIQLMNDKEALNRLDKEQEEKELMEYQESNMYDSNKTVDNNDDLC